MTIHVVRPGDSIYKISRQYGVDSQTIINENNITNPDDLVVGQTIVIRTPDIRHTVAAGESMYSIARRYGIPLDRLIRANPNIPNPARLQRGQVINIPRTPEKLGTIDVNGYAFPNISMSVLNSTLPYLTFLSIFSYEVRENGSLQPINDAPLIQAARAANVAPVMVITNIDQDGGFSSDLAHTILTNQQVQDTLIENVISTLQSKNYYGLDVDFEYIYPEDRENYNNFLRKISRRLRALGMILVTSIAPKISADQQGLLYEAHDYPVHGALADHVVIMTYEWGYTYGPAMAVSPIDQVIRVLNYAVTAIPRQKILMGMPNYGYDWTLPFVEGSAARTLTNQQAIEQAARVNARIEFDTTSMAPFYNYYVNGVQHEVWFDDARSIEARLRLINRYNLGGASYWTINSFFAQNWLVLDSLYNVRKVI